jgi:hypothetical protein
MVKRERLACRMFKVNLDIFFPLKMRALGKYNFLMTSWW